VFAMPVGNTTHNRPFPSIAAATSRAKHADFWAIREGSIDCLKRVGGMRIVHDHLKTLSSFDPFGTPCDTPAGFKASFDVFDRDAEGFGGGCCGKQIVEIEFAGKR
jgi:hypothetical protein